MNFKKYHVSKNLLDYTSLTMQQGAYIDDNGNLVTTGATAVVAIIYWSWVPVSELTEYCMSCATSRPWTRVYFYDSNKNFLSRSSANNANDTAKSFTTPTNCAYVNFQEWIGNNPSNELNTVMLNTGSTPLPYEPYSSEVWHDTPHYIHKTDTDTITTLPAVLYPTGTTATVGLKGNTLQSSIPSPTSPVMPQETGERTGNLWNEEGFSARAITSTHEHTDANAYGTTLSTTIGKETIITQSEYPTGTVGYQNGFFFIDVDFSKYEIGDKVTLSFDYICNEVHSIEGQISTTLYAGKNSNSIPVVLSSGKWSVSGRLTAVITIIADMNPYVEVRLCGNSITVKNIMLNTGSEALPYEPYGYKIPISSASTTTPVYLGEVQTTRKIKKYEFTGNEEWLKGNYAPSGGYQFFTPKPSGIADNPDWLLSHFKKGSGLNGSAFASYLSLYPETSILPENATANDFKSYLAAQYAAGTPVTVWYVLANEETAVVNEPLMKIGDYADEVSGITIPTIAGANTIDIDTTLKPSEVTVNYHGWHPVADVHERDNGQWD